MKEWRKDRAGLYRHIKGAKVRSDGYGAWFAEIPKEQGGVNYTLWQGMKAAKQHCEDFYKKTTK